MDIGQFKDSVEKDSFPEFHSPLLQALWLERRGEWDKAHSIVQQIPTKLGSWVHAYLHRVEGDLGNARYWYRRAGRKESDLPHWEEWEEIAEYLLYDESH